MSAMLLKLALPLVVGPVTFLAMQGLKGVSATVEALPPIAKRSAVLVIAMLLTAVGGATGVDLNCNTESGVNCLTTLNADAVKAVVGAALAFVLHYAKRAKAS